MTLSAPYRWLAVLVLVAGLLAGGLWYRASLIQDGRDQEAAEAVVRQNQAVAAAKASDAAVTASTVAALNASLIQLQNQHDRITSDLSVALADSDHRRQRLDARVARLLDEAAGIRDRIASAASGTGGPAGEAGADQAQPDASVADLAESVATNYAICLRNGERLEALQDWYTRLRASRR